jgi:23S rRNA (adenine2503-C2)-methyltransferase
MPTHPDNRPSLLSCGPEKLSALLGGPGRARNVWKALQDGETLENTLTAGALQRLNQKVSLDLLEPVKKSTAACGTRKLLLPLHDGHFIESVVIPNPSRTTVCVSSQVGCARGCRFCMTATMGIIRNLRVHEIVGQVVAAVAEAKAAGMAPIRNVVFMGMGEPLDNLAEVEKSLDILTDGRAMGLSSNHITVSTVGGSAQKLRRLGKLPAQIAWSVHAVEENLRKRLVPTTQISMETMRDVFSEILEARNDTIFVEVTLMDGVNDSDVCARELAEFLKPCPGDVRVNLLPLNEGREGLMPSGKARVEAFAKVIAASGLRTLVRTPRGQEENAACGQLVVLEQGG